MNSHLRSILIGALICVSLGTGYYFYDPSFISSLIPSTSTPVVKVLPVQKRNKNLAQIKAAEPAKEDVKNEPPAGAGDAVAADADDDTESDSAVREPASLEPAKKTSSAPAPALAELPKVNATTEGASDASLSKDGSEDGDARPANFMFGDASLYLRYKNNLLKIKLKRGYISDSKQLRPLLARAFRRSCLILKKATAPRSVTRFRKLWLI